MLSTITTIYSDYKKQKMYHHRVVIPSSNNSSATTHVPPKYICTSLNIDTNKTEYLDEHNTACYKFKLYDVDITRRDKTSDEYKILKSIYNSLYVIIHKDITVRTRQPIIQYIKTDSHDMIVNYLIKTNLILTINIHDYNSLHSFNV